MTGEPTDLLRAQAALARLDAAVERWPRLRSPEAQQRLAGWLAEQQEEDMGAKPAVQVRLSPDLLERATALIPRIKGEMEWARVSRSAVLQMAIAEGLAVLEKRYPSRKRGGSKK